MHLNSEVTFTVATLAHAGMSARDIGIILKAANVSCSRRTIYRVIARAQAPGVRS